MVRLKHAAVSGGGDGDVAPRADGEAAARLHGCGLRTHVAAGHHQDIASAGHLAANLLSGGLLQPVIFIPRQVIAGGGSDGGEVQIPPGTEHRLASTAAVNDLRAGQGEIAPGVQHQLTVIALDVDPRHALHGGALKAVFPAAALCAAGGGGEADVAPGGGQYGMVT